MVYICGDAWPGQQILRKWKTCPELSLSRLLFALYSQDPRILYDYPVLYLWHLLTSKSIKVFCSSYLFLFWTPFTQLITTPVFFSHVTDSGLALAIDGFLCDATGCLKEIGRVVHGDLLRDPVLAWIDPDRSNTCHQGFSWLGGTSTLW